MNSAQESEYVLNLIDDKLAHRYDYRDIAIIARTKNQLIEYRDILTKANVPCKYLDSKEVMDFQDNSIKLLTMHSIKGLEFKVVILVGLNEKVLLNQHNLSGGADEEFYISMERKLLYVGMTRFILMGSIILLMPENKNYEPIQVRADQAKIIGVAVGIIKRK